MRECVHRLKILFNPVRRARRLVAVDETVVKRHSVNHYSEIITIYASVERRIARALGVHVIHRY